MSAKNVISDRTAALLEKQRELDERIKRSLQRDRSVSRKSRNRALLLIGVSIERQIKRQPSYLATVRSFVTGLKDHEQEAVTTFLDTLLADAPTPNSTTPGAMSSITSPLVPQRSEMVDP
ncbi:hypothetical protein [Lysobacter silvisoli]|uniref:hypothetical protein n=1 Tax=Lysobacter silvisoli TaxID=2293254 RepID=UPI0011C02461|nr:hypothetical protein [Lysobacter silvisoli]